MSQWLFIAALTISSSLDNLGVGLSYGIRDIRIGVRSNLLISFICFIFSACGIYFGMWVSVILPGVLPIILGSFILIIIGVRLVLLGVPRKGKEPQIAQVVDEANYNQKTENPDSTNPYIPSKSQPKKIRSIGILESIILGIALSANALTNGIGAGLLGFPPLLISLLAAVGSFITIQAGTAFGVKLAKVQIGKFTIGQFGTIISGCLLMIIAISIFLH
jgi:putative sporulation protein YtaF